MTDVSENRYTIQDFHDISLDGFNYTISEATLDIISALASQVGAPDYIRTPNFTTHNISRDGRGRGTGSGGGGRRRKQHQEMSDSDWEDLRTFHSKPKAEISPEKALEKRLRGELNKVVGGCSQSQLESIADTMIEMIKSGKQCESVAEKVFYDLATCSKINVNIFAGLFVDMISYIDSDSYQSRHMRNNDSDDSDNSECLFDFLKKSLESFIGDDGVWMRMFQNVEYISEDVDYDRFCDVNKVNDLRLNTTRFVAKVFQLLFEKEDDRFFWLGQLSGCYWKIFCGFKDELRKDENEDVAMIYCSNIIELMKTLGESVTDIENGDAFWNGVVEDQEQIIASGQRAYPSLTRRIVFAIQDAFDIHQ